MQQKRLTNMEQGITSVSGLRSKYNRLYAKMIEGLGDEYCEETETGELISLIDAYPLTFTTEFAQQSLTVYEGTFSLNYHKYMDEFWVVARGDADEILYSALGAAALAISSNWEIKNRNEAEEDSRHLFDGQVALLAKVNPDWAARQKEDNEQILQQL